MNVNIVERKLFWIISVVLLILACAIVASEYSDSLINEKQSVVMADDEQAQENPINQTTTAEAQNPIF